MSNVEKWITIKSIDFDKTFSSLSDIARMMRAPREEARILLGEGYKLILDARVVRIKARERRELQVRLADNMSEATFKLLYCKQD